MTHFPHTESPSAELKGVSLSYPKGPMVLDGLDWQLLPGRDAPLHLLDELAVDGLGRAGVDVNEVGGIHGVLPTCTSTIVHIDSCRQPPVSSGFDGPASAQNGKALFAPVNGERIAHSSLRLSVKECLESRHFLLPRAHQ